MIYTEGKGPPAGPVRGTHVVEDEEALGLPEGGFREGGAQIDGLREEADGFDGVIGGGHQGQACGASREPGQTAGRDPVATANTPPLATSHGGKTSGGGVVQLLFF